MSPRFRHALPFTLVLVALAALTTPTHAQRGRERDSGAEFGWLDYSAGLTEAKKTGKPIMLVFRCVP
jgi:hypothetical protein